MSFKSNPESLILMGSMTCPGGYEWTLCFKVQDGGFLENAPGTTDKFLDIHITQYQAIALKKHLEHLLALLEKGSIDSRETLKKKFILE